MNPITWVQALQGPALIAVICGLLFVEEVGVPLFFTPGDIVLAIGGIAIAGGRCNPAALVAAAAVASIGGAMLGREAFAVIGWDRLMKLAEPLHARGALERASSLLERGGWRAVFTARLIPGLRVYTTQVAGVSRMSRVTFFTGLVPATAVYVAAFIGLGAAIGRPVLALISQAERQALLAAALIIVLIVVVLLTRAPVRQALASLYAAGWTGPLKLRLDSVSLVLVLGTIGLNFAGHALAVGLRLPLFLDSIGTVLAGLIGGPWVGGSVGFVSNLITSDTIDPIAAPYAIVSFAVGFAAGLSRYLNWHKRPTGWLGLWLLCFTIAAIVSTPLNLLVNDGKTSVGFGDAIYALLSGLHVPAVLAAFLGEAAVDLPDKLITVAAALLIAHGFSAPQSQPAIAEIDLGEALTFVFHSRRWRRKFAAAALCVLLFWLVVPYLLLSGYLIDLCRERRAGRRELPDWDRRWFKVKDGFKINLVLLLWALPGVLLSIVAAILGSAPQSGSIAMVSLSAVVAVLAAIGSLWVILVLLFEPAIFTAYLDGGIGAAINLRHVARRLQVNVALSLVVGALVIVLTVLGFVGLLGVLVGALITFPYTSFVGAYLIGYYAAVTDRQLDPATVPGAVRV